MERPKIRHPFGRQRGDYYLVTDIDPLLDELEMLKAEKKPFPDFEEFEKWYHNQKSGYVPKIVYDYFSQFKYEKTVFPKVAEEYEFSDDGKDWYKDTFMQFSCLYGEYEKIRPVTTSTREVVIAQVESKLKSNELTFDRELVEQFLNILKGQDNE